MNFHLPFQCFVSDCGLLFTLALSFVNRTELSLFSMVYFKKYTFYFRTKVKFDKLLIVMEVKLIYSHTLIVPH